LFVGVLVFFLFILGFAMRNFPLSEGNFEKDITPLMTTSDANYFTWRVKNAYDTEMPVVEPPYTALGIENAVSVYPPLIYTFMGSLTKLTGVSPYQMGWFLICLLSALIPLYAFVVVKRYFNFELALLVLTLGLFTSSKFLFQTYIGFWADVFAFAPAAAMFYFLQDVWKDKSYLPLVITAGLATATFVGHVWEFAYFILLVMITGFFIVLKKVGKTGIKNIVIVVLLVGVFSFTFLSKYNVIGYGTGEALKIGENRGGPPAYFEQAKLGLFSGILTFVGIVAIVLKFKSKFSIYEFSILLIPLFILFQKYSTLIGVEPNHTYRQLYHGFVFLIIPAAIGINWILDLIKKEIGSNAKKIGLGLVLCMLIVIPFGSTFNNLKGLQEASRLKQPEWDSLMWIRDNTPRNSKVLVLFGHYGQGLDIYGERQTLYDVYSENLQQICNQTIPDKFKGSWKYNALTPDGFKILGTGEYVQPVFTDPQAGVPLEEFDYILIRYKGTQIDSCMGFFINEMMQCNNSVVWNSDQIVIVEVKNGT